MAHPSSSRFGADGGAVFDSNASTRDVRVLRSLLSSVEKWSTSGRQRLKVSMSRSMDFICAASASSFSSVFAIRADRVGGLGLRASGRGGGDDGGGGGSIGGGGGSGGSTVAREKRIGRVSIEVRLVEGVLRESGR
jgi:hypothetical protein